MPASGASTGSRSSGQDLTHAELHPHSLERTAPLGIGLTNWATPNEDSLELFQAAERHSAGNPHAEKLTEQAADPLGHDRLPRSCVGVVFLAQTAIHLRYRPVAHLYQHRAWHTSVCPVVLKSLARNCNPWVRQMRSLRAWPTRDPYSSIAKRPCKPTTEVYRTPVRQWWWLCCG